MPTGYTAGVVDGTIDTFEKFALQCARAFGALIDMRDDSFDAPIPNTFHPSNYNKKSLDEAKARLADLQAMTIDQAAAACTADYEKRISDRASCRARDKAENDRLDAMLAHAEAWEPPSANHVEMKSFMIEQINMSRHDIDALDRLSPIEKLTPQEWLRKQIEKAHGDIGYNAAAHEKEIARTNGRNEWVKQLRASLSPESRP